MGAPSLPSPPSHPPLTLLPSSTSRQASFPFPRLSSRAPFSLSSSPHRIPPLPSTPRATSLYPRFLLSPRFLPSFLPLFLHHASLIFLLLHALFPSPSPFLRHLPDSLPASPLFLSPHPLAAPDPRNLSIYTFARQVPLLSSLLGL